MTPWRCAHIRDSSCLTSDRGGIVSLFVFAFVLILFIAVYMCVHVVCVYMLSLCVHACMCVCACVGVVCSPGGALPQLGGTAVLS